MRMHVARAWVAARACVRREGGCHFNRCCRRLCRRSGGRRRRRM